MAAGDSKLAQEYPLQAGKGVYNNSTDTFRIFFCSDTYASIDATQTPFNLSDVTQVGGGNFPIAGIVLTSVTWTRSGAVSKLDYADLTTIAKNASNPATIRTAVIVNDTSASDDIYKVVDLTADGSTAIDVVNNDFDYAVNASGSVTGTVA
tara:strand:+ start:207 stop:659 length:453 start_codon:yes stop_codon:yes gene_type:complete